MHGPGTLLWHARAGDFVVACTGRGLCCGMHGPGTLECFICCPSPLPSTFVIAICSSPPLLPSPGIPLSRQLQRDVSSPTQISRSGSAGSSPSRTPAMVWCGVCVVVWCVCGSMVCVWYYGVCVVVWCVCGSMVCVCVVVFQVLFGSPRHRVSLVPRPCLQTVGLGRRGRLSCSAGVH